MTWRQSDAKPPLEAMLTKTMTHIFPPFYKSITIVLRADAAVFLHIYSNFFFIHSIIMLFRLLPLWYGFYCWILCIYFYCFTVLVYDSRVIFDSLLSIKIIIILSRTVSFDARVKCAVNPSELAALGLVSLIYICLFIELFLHVF